MPSAPSAAATRKRVVGREAPDLLARPLAARRPADARARPRPSDRARPASPRDCRRAPARAAAIALESRGQPAAEAERREAFGQHARQQFLARIAGDVEPDARDELGRDLVAHQAVHLHFHRRGLLGACGVCRARRRRPAAPAARRAARRRRDRRCAVDVGSGSDFGTRAPFEAAGDGVAARRRAAGSAHRQWRRPAAGCAVDPHVARPVLDIAGQRDPAFGVHLPALREPAAARVDVQREAFGPDAAKSAGVDGLSGLQVWPRRGTDSGGIPRRVVPSPASRAGTVASPAAPANSMEPQNASAASAARTNMRIGMPSNPRLTASCNNAIGRAIGLTSRRSMRTANDVLEFWFGRGPLDAARLAERSAFWFGGDDAETAAARDALIRDNARAHARAARRAASSPHGPRARSAAWR